MDTEQVEGCRHSVVRVRYFPRITCHVFTQQAHVRKRLIGGDPVRSFVALQHGQRKIARAPRRRALEQRSGRREWAVRILQVKPQKERARIIARLEPRAECADRARHHPLIGRGSFAFEAWKLVVVVFETAIEPGSALQDRVADEGRGCVTRVAETLGQGRKPFEAGVAVALTDRVIAGRAARHDRRVRRRRRRRSGNRVREDHAARGERIDGGRDRTGIAVGPDMIRPQRIDRDQQNIGLGAPLARPRRFPRLVSIAAGENAEDQERKEQRVWLGPMPRVARRMIGP